MSISRQITWLVIILSLVGLIMIGSSSIVDASRDFGNQWYYLRQQSVWFLLGLLSLFFFSHYNHKNLLKYSVPLLALTICLLIAVLIPGIGTSLLGARRWINLGFFVIQPAEMAKFTLAVYISGLVVKTQKLPQMLLLLTGSLALIVSEPDLGTAIVIIGMGMLIYFGGGGNVFKLILVSLLGLILVVGLIFLSPYRINRINSFFNSNTDPLGSSYQVRQALIALGSGGFGGLGIGQSRQKYDFLPESMTDSIFAIIGEEFGLIGTGILIGAYITLIIRGFEVAKLSTIPFSRNLAIAATSIIGLQAFINISAITSLFPLTGIPLTFISYGGSSLIVMLSLSGVLINIAKTYA